MCEKKKRLQAISAKMALLGDHKHDLLVELKEVDDELDQLAREYEQLSAQGE